MCPVQFNSIQFNNLRVLVPVRNSPVAITNTFTNVNSPKTQIHLKLTTNKKPQGAQSDEHSTIQPNPLGTQGGDTRVGIPQDVHGYKLKKNAPNR
jgi:hypothetical protein